MTIFIYKVVRSFKHKVHGWIKTGRFVKCRPEYSRNHLIRRELIRCTTGTQDSDIDTVWIDTEPEPEEEKKELKKEIKKPILKRKTK